MPRSARRVENQSKPSSLWETRRFVEQLHGWLVEGKTIGIHCRQSVGRAALLAARLLVQAGVDEDAAFGRVGVARGCVVPETAEQREWNERFAALTAVPAL